MNDSKLNDLAIKLEGVLRNYLNCNSTDFGVKSNDNLISKDWKSPINFALGYKYAKSNNSSEIKDEIGTFLGEILVGEHMLDLVKNYEYYEFSNESEAYSCIDNMIKELTEILTLNEF